jgi:hypothetical protein
VLAAARQRPTAEAAIHARCRQPTGGEQGRYCAAFKRLVLSSAAASSARKWADCRPAAKGVSRRSLLRKLAVVCYSARRTGTSLAQAASQWQRHVTRHMSHVTHRAPAVTRRVKDSVYLRCSMRVVARRSQARFRSSTSQSSCHAATFAASRRRLLNSHFIPVLYEI